MITNLGVGTDPQLSPQQTWPVYCSSEPDELDQLQTTYDTESQNDGRSMIDGEVYLHYGVMVRFRDTRSNLVYAQAALVAHAFAESVENLVVIMSNPTASYVVCAINRKGNVIQLGAEFPTSERKAATLNIIAAMYRIV